MDDGYLQRFVEETEWYNEIVLGAILPAEYWKGIPHACRTWLRNYIAGTIIYFLSGVLWSAYIYGLKRHVYFPKDQAFLAIGSVCLCGLAFLMKDESDSFWIQTFLTNLGVALAFRLVRILKEDVD